MAKKKSEATDLPEEALDRFVGVVDGPLNRAMERMMKSRVLLFPMSLSMMASMKALALTKKALKERA